MTYAASFFYGEIGAFAVIKYPMGQEFSFSPSFLGLSSSILGFLDLLRNFGFFTGTLYALAFPFRQPKKAFVLLTLAKCILLAMLIFQKWMGKYDDLYCAVLMFGLGFLKLQNSPMLYIMSNFRTNLAQFFDSKTEQFELNLFFAIASLGDFFSLYIGELVMNVLGLDWTLFVVCFSLLLCMSIVLVERYMNEYPIEYEPADSLIQSVSGKLGNMKLIFCHYKRLLVVLENMLLIGFYYNILLWYPYYFTEIGYASYTIHLSVITPLLCFFGCLAFESLIKLCSNYSHWFISALLMVSTFSQFQMIWLVGEPNSSSTVSSFFWWIFVYSLCLSGPLNTVYMTEMSFLTSNNKVAAMYIFLVHSLFCRLFNMGSMLSIGYLLEISTYAPT